MCGKPKVAHAESTGHTHTHTQFNEVAVALRAPCVVCLKVPVRILELLQGLLQSLLLVGQSLMKSCNESSRQGAVIACKINTQLLLHTNRKVVLH